MQFAQVIGQQRTKAQLWQIYQSGKIPHAILFTAPKGAGGLPMGLAWARMLMCESPTPEGACNQCAACGKSHKHIHPDIHFSFPTVGAKVTSDTFLKEWRDFLTTTPYADAFSWLQKIGAENKQGNINAEETSGISKKLSFQVLEGKYKILLMWMPEYLGKEGNRLLKLIEEPPERTIFILVAEQTELILQTILSRCQLIKLDPLSQSEVIDALMHNHAIPREDAEKRAFLADGNYAEAEQLNLDDTHDEGKLLTLWLRACWQGEPLVINEQTEAFSDLGREAQKQFLRYALQFFRELIVALVVGNKPLRLPEDIAEMARKFAQVVDFDQCEAICKRLNDDISHIERNANAKILFTATSIEVHEVLRKLVRAK